MDGLRRVQCAMSNSFQSILQPVPCPCFDRNLSISVDDLAQVSEDGLPSFRCILHNVLKLTCCLDDTRAEVLAKYVDASHVSRHSVQDRELGDVVSYQRRTPRYFYVESVTR